VSAGPRLPKERLLPLVARLTEHKVEVFATVGTARYFNARRERHRGAQDHGCGRAEHRTLLEGRFLDCVINILTGEVSITMSRPTAGLSALWR